MGYVHEAVARMRALAEAPTLGNLHPDARAQAIARATFDFPTTLKESAMHYRNGREAKNGDTIIQIGFNGKINALGVLYNATPGNDYCNGQIAPVQQMPVGTCMVDCLHVDDLMAILKEKGLDKRPEGK